ncbi:MAG: hypothetical protein EON52_08965, partial [Actinomycetales bacterium]
MAVDFKTLGKNDQVLLVAGALTVILTFFPAYAKATAKAKGDAADLVTNSSFSETHNAWVEWATFGTLLLIVAFVLVAIRLFAPGTLPTTVPWNLVVAGAATLGTVLLVLYVFTFGEDVPAQLKSSVDYSTGPGWSG